MSTETATRPRIRRVIRLHRLPEFLGVRRSQIDAAVRAGKLTPYSPLGGRAMVVDEDEVIALQEAAKARAKGVDR
jgi:predicted DNA-binding transcriptional regulator AlpA